MKNRNFIGCAVLALLAIAQAPCLAATFNVNSNADTASPPAGTVTLRSAIAAANAAGGSNVVNVPAGLGPYNLTLGALTTTNASNNILLVQGSGGSAVIDAGGLSGVFRLTGGTVTLSGLTIQNGSAPSPNPGSNGICSGGGVFIGASTTVNIISSVVTNNQTPNASGGGICVTGTLNLSNSTVSNNNGPDGGGGIRVSIAATANIANSTVSNNQAAAIGAAGGGIENQGTLTVTNSTISGNLANGGSAVSQETEGSTALSNVTVAGNSSPGSAQLASFGGANISVVSTIVANPAAGANCFAASGGTITSHGHNLDSANSCGFASAGDLINTNPLLRSLQNNGGSTSTMALLSGSPAIDAVPLASCNVNTDQRGVPRPQGTACDIGAFEVILTACAAPPSGMVAWWPMDETAGATSLQDIIGGNDATPSASPVGAAQGPQPVPGEVGGAMQFPKFGNGFSGSRVSPQGALASIGSADFTIDAWVQVPPAAANRLHYVVNKFDAVQNKGYALYLVSPGVAGSERLEFKWGDGTNVSTVQTSSPITTGQFHHVAVTFARNIGGFALDIRLYVDGAQQGQQTANSPVGSLVNFIFLEIGWQPGTIDEPITIDELEIFNRVLLQSEIQSIVNAGNAGKCKTMPLPTEPTNIVGGGAACFPLQQPPGSPPVVSYKPLLARPLGEAISGNNYSWLFELGAFAGPVDSYLLLQLPNSGLLFLEEQPTLQWSPAPVTLVPSTSGPVTFSPLFTVPYNFLAGTGTFLGHVFVVPAGTNPATFSLATSPYYHWCFQRTF